MELIEILQTRDTGTEQATAESFFHVWPPSCDFDALRNGSGQSRRKQKLMLQHGANAASRQ